MRIRRLLLAIALTVGSIAFTASPAHATTCGNPTGSPLACPGPSFWTWSNETFEVRNLPWRLDSPSATHQLVYQSDGNLVTYRESIWGTGAATWQSATIGSVEIDLRANCEMRLIAPTGATMWNTAGYYQNVTFCGIQLLDTGQMTTYRYDGVAAQWIPIQTFGVAA